MNKEYDLCKEKLTRILEESDRILTVWGKEIDVDYLIKNEFKSKSPEYLIESNPENPKYSKIAEKVLIEFCEKNKIFRKKDGKKFRLFERFDIKRYRYFVSEGIA